MEHLQHFGLAQDPFQNEPDLRFYFESAAHADAQRRVERGLRQAKGLTVLTAEPGTGKSLLTRRILEGLEEELFEACMMVAVKGVTGRGAFLTRVARQLEVEEPAEDPAALMGQIYESLAVVREDGRHAVLLIDEADALSADAFAELSALLNLEYEDRRLVSILLVGSPSLESELGREPALLQRVDVRVRLEGLSLEDAGSYLTHRIATVGGGTAILPKDAIEALFKFGRGRPRLMNTLADNALFEAFLAGRPAITPLDVERAASDLGVGVDPGTTYSAMPVSPLALPDDANGASLGTMAPPVLGELTDPSAGAALDLGNSASSMPGDSDPLLGPDSESMTTVHVGPDASSSALDLSQPVAELEPPPDLGASLTTLPTFEASNRPEAAEAEATRLALPEEEVELTATPNPGDTDGEIDDLFVELLDD